VLYLDVTDTLLNWSGPPTGVHRTLIGLACTAVKTERGKLCAWQREGNLWHEVPLADFLGVFDSCGTAKPESLVEEAPAERPVGLRRGPLRHFLGALCRRAHHVVLVARSRLREKEGALPRSEPPQGKWSEVYEVRQQKLAQLPLLPGWSPGDRLLVPDSTWNQSGFFAALHARPDRPQVIGFIYDMIQLERPDFVGKRVQEQFRIWATEVARNSVEIVCISKHAACGMQKFVDDLALGDKAPFVRPIKFGNKIDDNARNGSAKIPDELLPPRLEGQSEWILWLGSVDRRKNLDVVLLALEGLYGTGRLRKKFVVAGRMAGGSGELIHRLRYNPLLRENIVLLDAPSDHMLRQLLIGSSLVVFSSWAEGYGLPVAEALQAGIPVIASNATSIPEVAGDLVDYFEPWNSGKLANLIERFETDHDYRVDLQMRARRFVPTDWNETLDDITADLSCKDD
jgi:glycosyltransferase involved in cell wall biosynthesis